MPGKNLERPRRIGRFGGGDENNGRGGANGPKAHAEDVVSHHGGYQRKGSDRSTIWPITAGPIATGPSSAIDTARIVTVHYKKPTNQLKSSELSEIPAHSMSQ